jgi:enoyl-CoA hydratase
MGDDVLIERDGSILLLTISRPQARNAINPTVAEAIADAMDDLESDNTLSVAVLTGAGGNFSAGMDLKAFAEGGSVHTRRGMLGMTEHPPTKPVIAAVEGWALAGGFELVLSCDMVVAASGAKFGIPEVKRGLVAAAGGLLRLASALPYQLATELALTGEPFTAERLHASGLVNRLVEPGQALEQALALAHQIAQNGPLAVRTSKWILATAAHWIGEEVWDRQQDRVAEVFSSDDALEGARAFAEKRIPNWTGT